MFRVENCRTIHSTTPTPLIHTAFRSATWQICALKHTHTYTLTLTHVRLRHTYANPSLIRSNTNKPPSHHPENPPAASKRCRRAHNVDLFDTSSRRRTSSSAHAAHASHARTHAPFSANIARSQIVERVHTRSTGWAPTRQTHGTFTGLRRIWNQCLRSVRSVAGINIICTKCVPVVFVRFGAGFGRGGRFGWASVWWSVRCVYLAIAIDFDLPKHAHESSCFGCEFVLHSFWLVMMLLLIAAQRYSMRCMRFGPMFLIPDPVHSAGTRKRAHNCTFPHVRTQPSILVTSNSRTW